MTSDVSWSDNASDEFLVDGAYWISEAELAADEEELGIG